MKAHSLQLMGYLEKPPWRLISGSREAGGFGGPTKSYANGAEEEKRTSAVMSGEF